MKLFLLSVMLIVLTGCITSHHRAHIVPTEEVLDVSPRETERALLQHISILLQKADEAFQRDRLTVPANASAYYWYREILALDANNTKAHEGMRQISARLMVLAEAAFKEGRRSRAEWLMSKALSIATLASEVDALRARYPEPVAPNTFLIDSDELAKRSSVLVEYLEGLALKAQKSSSRLVIVTRNDADGRWIYQQMRQAVAGYRLRGNIERGNTPKVVLIDLL